MPNRVLREGLLDSEPVSALHDTTFRLYVSILLSGDDYGLCDIGFGAVKKANPLQSWSREAIFKMLEEITDAKLIAPYEHRGKMYAAIARWRAKIQSRAPKHPAPPFGFGHCLEPYGFKDDETRRSYILIINGMTSARAYPDKLQLTPGADPENEGGRGKGEVLKGKGKKRARTRAERFALPTWIPEDAWQAWEDHRQRIRKPLTDYARKLCMSRLNDLRELGHLPRTCINLAIESGWQKFWPPKPSGPADRSTLRGERDKRAADAFIRRVANGSGSAPLTLEHEPKGSTDEQRGRRDSSE